MAQNFLFNSFPVFSYFTLWLLVGAAGYYYTSEKLPPPSDKTYLYGAILNLLTVPLVYLIPLTYVAFIAAAVQAGPILYDYRAVHR
ncbi:MAG: hypothetical protein ABEK16_02325 [Candidatus Nanohalobium sp.]